MATGLFDRLRNTSVPKAKRIAAMASAACVLPVIVFGVSGLRINTSESLPLGLYRVTSDKRSPYVEFCPPEPYASLAISRGYRSAGNCADGAAPLMKPVVAKQGDTVEISGLSIAVNGKLLPKSAASLTDSRGRPMSAWSPGRYTVAAGSVWVVSSYHARSFDSRYFGPIPLAAVRHRLAPFLTQ